MADLDSLRLMLNVPVHPVTVAPTLLRAHRLIDRHVALR